MTLYLDASALIKRYLAEEGRGRLMAAMQEAEAWAASRLAFAETARGLRLAAPEGVRLVDALRGDWSDFEVVELDQAVCEHAAELGAQHRLRTLDAVHLASALALEEAHPALATWDRRLWDAAVAVGLRPVPEDRP